METKETTELLTGIETLLVSAKKMFADGKVNLADLPALMSLLNKVGEITAAIQGADQVPAEIKDLSPEEAQQVVEKLFAVIAAVKAA